jgi:hypothetical protein
MSFAFDLYYRSPEDKAREIKIMAAVTVAGGRLDYREPADRPNGPICLTFELQELHLAELTATSLRQQGEHVEGVYDYG